MFKRLHGWLFGLGIMLILAGFTVLIRLDSAQAARIDSERLQIVEAIVDLQSCFCHAVSGETSLLARHLDHAAVLVAHVPSQPETDRRASVETRLIAAGQLLLALPTAPDEPAQAVTTGFLQVYAQTRANGPTPTTLAALDQLEYWLSILENQAQTDQWDRAEAAPELPDGSAWLPVSLVSRDHSAAFEWAGLWPDAARLLGLVSDDHRAVRRAEDMFGVHRRGPPAGAPYTMV